VSPTQSESRSQRAPVVDETIALSIILPAYNEQSRISHGLDELRAAIATGPLDQDRVEVLLIDDGSTDGTAAAAKRVLAKFPHARMLRLPTNRGKGAAIRVGVAAARGSSLVFMDADMAVPPSGITELLAALEVADVAIGSRTHGEASIESASLHRIVMGRTFHRVARTTARVPYRDTQCGFKAFLTPAARLLFHCTTIDRYAFDVELLALAGRLSLTVKEVPVHWRQVPGSRIRLPLDPLSMIWDLARFRIGKTVRPEVIGVKMSNGRGSVDLKERARQVLGPTLPIVPERGSDVLVLFPLCNSEEADRLTGLLQTACAGATLERVSLAVSELESIFQRAKMADGELHIVTGSGDAAKGAQRDADVVFLTGEKPTSAAQGL
jgi:glycosyltransferase involved in cell wall biosynthesis